jgi:hypothetical protein
MVVEMTTPAAGVAIAIVIIEPEKRCMMVSFCFEAITSNGASLRRHVLPKDLPGAIKQLDDKELDRLLAAALVEQKRRDRKPSVPNQTPGKPQIEAAAVHLSPGKLNVVRAAFKAGVKPSQIARQLGLSQSDVRKALASR